MIQLYDDVWALAALAGLTGMGPRRLRAVLAERTPTRAWQAIQRGALSIQPEDMAVFRGRLPALLQSWADEARQRSPDQLLSRCRALGIEAVAYGAPNYPAALVEDPDPPLLLFVSGDLASLQRPTVAVVGTRRATPYGLSVATTLGRELADAGIAVVSGLASGIDGAAHRGALQADEGAPPVGVVGSGLDVVYPHRHRSLWNAVAERGVLFSEAPPGTHPENWRFPARNRIIAALASVLVVVESPLEGGSMITVEEALTRQRSVLAVPGSIYSPASIGTNKLLSEGCGLLTSVADVLDELKLSRRPNQMPSDARTSSEMHNTEENAVLAAIGWEPALVDEVALRSGLPLPQVITAIEHLVAGGELVRDSIHVRRISTQISVL
ncbi:MAG: processing protein [Acidimicrobiia bacterium]|nr:processing protein [Acidimicrobiia bacterium]